MQRQAEKNLSLLSAVLQDSAVYILDDPLSAVDAHVGKHIFDHVVGPNGMLRDRIRVFVTHGVQYLPQCTQVCISDGWIEDD